MKKLKPKIKLSKKGLLRYNMILAWATKKRPFVTQKLSFNAPPQFHLAYREAKAIKNSLWRAGGLKKSSVKLLAVSVDGVLEDYQNEHAPFLKKRAQELKEQVKRFSNDDSKTVPKTAKAAIKAKKYTPTLADKDGNYKFIVGGIRVSDDTKTKPVKPIIQAKPKPMIEALKPKKKINKKVK